MSEYIKKEDILACQTTFTDEAGYEYKVIEVEEIEDLPTYSFPDSEPMKVVDNQVVIVSNYATDALQDTLDKYAENGYRLVNAILAKNKYNIDVMYLFFTKAESEKP